MIKSACTLCEEKVCHCRYAILLEPYVRRPVTIVPSLQQLRIYMHCVYAVFYVILIQDIPPQIGNPLVEHVPLRPKHFSFSQRSAKLFVRKWELQVRVLKVARNYLSNAEQCDSLLECGHVSVRACVCVWDSLHSLKRLFRKQFSITGTVLKLHTNTILWSTFLVLNVAMICRREQLLWLIIFFEKLLKVVTLNKRFAVRKDVRSNWR